MMLNTKHAAGCPHLQEYSTNNQRILSTAKQQYQQNPVGLNVLSFTNLYPLEWLVFYRQILYAVPLEGVGYIFVSKVSFTFFALFDLD